jgi:hypothetical protein
MSRSDGTQRRGTVDPVTGSALAVVSLLYLLFLVWLLATGGGGLPIWLIALTLLPLLAALATYVAAIVIEFGAMRRDRRDGPAAPTGAGPDAPAD